MGANFSEVSGSGPRTCTGVKDEDDTVGNSFSGAPGPLALNSNPAAARERKKKWWKRRTSRGTDPGRPLRDLLNSWCFADVVALVEVYDGLALEKELYLACESARPRPASLRSDLGDLLDFKWTSDVSLILPPAIFPAHRPLLMQRSKYFRHLLTASHITTSVSLEDVTGVDIPTFSSLLRFLYTEEATHTHHFLPFADIFGRPRSLDVDMRELLQTGKYSDVILVFGDEQLPCHKCVLAARSPFFRSLLQRRSNSKKIVLDENVIPKRYARVILQCMYTDRVELSLIDPTRTGLTEVESLTFTGRVNPAGFEEAMELYQIGRFLEFDQLCQTSEDIIMEQLTFESVPSVLRWSNQPHGSSWVRRQVMTFLREEFNSIASTPSFLELDKQVLTELLDSDFLQTSEVDILQAILRWGEHQLIRRVEDREPNLLTTTRDSVTRKGIKRRDLSDAELREIISDLVRFVRTDHILVNNEVLMSAVRRGLLSIPPSHMITEEKTNPWLCQTTVNFTRPRLFTPFYEEAKQSMRQRGPADHYHAHLTNTTRKTLRTIPDTLYMIDNSSDRSGISVAATVSVAKTAPSSLPPEDTGIETEVLAAMLYREKKLRSAHSRALNYSQSRQAISKFIRLRVVREFGYPDYVADILDTVKYSGAGDRVSSSDAVDPLTGNTSSKLKLEAYGPASSMVATSSSPVPGSEPHVLSEKMPDVAVLAAAHDLNMIGLEDVLDLDLGDGGANRSRPPQHSLSRPSRAYSTLHVEDGSHMIGQSSPGSSAQYSSAASLSRRRGPGHYVHRYNQFSHGNEQDVSSPHYL